MGALTSIAKDFAGGAYRGINRTLGPVCELIQPTGGWKTSEGLAPVFIIGAPRCGSTLVMQVITDAFDVAYLTNAHCRWFGAPALVERVWSPLAAKAPSDYQSCYGRTKLKTDPSECGVWWYRFFREFPPYVTSKDVEERKMRAFQRSIATMAAASGKPIVFKNLYAALRLEPIVEAFPKALFVIIERDLLDNAASILNARYEAYGTYDRWWSVPPPNVNQLNKCPAVQQAVEQIRSIQRLLQQNIERLSIHQRIFRVCYEDFCNDVHRILDQFYRFMQKHEVILEQRFKVPQYFEVSNQADIPQSLRDELVQYYQRTRSIK